MNSSIATDYVPAAGNWEHRDPEALGFDAAKLEEAVAFVMASETPQVEHHQRVNMDLPDNAVLGPLKEMGGVNGLVIRSGYIAAEFGDTLRTDMTYSVAKSYLSTVAGLAWDRGMLTDLDAPVRELLDDPVFQGEHNGQITWRHLLQQTSEWTGTLWSMRDIADRRKGVDRETHTPGSFWEYNDVRVNLLGYALLLLWRRPLRDVMHEYMMGPIGGSNDWEWHGYSTSWVTIDGERMQSVSGGTHFGGGVWTSSHNHARLGLLFQRDGRWGDQQILSEEWVRIATTSCEIEPVYGAMWWLNPNGMRWPKLSHSGYSANGAGGNFIWVDPGNDLTIVLRWVHPEKAQDCLAEIVGALKT